MADENPPSQPKPERKRLSTSTYETSIEKQIREAMERGDFNNLKNQGKKIDLGRDPNVPEEWDLAFSILKSAGYAPDWIETKKEVQAAQEKLLEPLTRFLANPPRDTEHRNKRAAELAAHFRTMANELNRMIDTYNLKAPSPQVHLRRIRVEYEIQKFLNAAK